MSAKAFIATCREVLRPLLGGVELASRKVYDAYRPALPGYRRLLASATASLQTIKPNLRAQCSSGARLPAIWYARYLLLTSFVAIFLFAVPTLMYWLTTSIFVLAEVAASKWRQLAAAARAGYKDLSGPHGVRSHLAIGALGLNLNWIGPSAIAAFRAGLDTRLPSVAARARRSLHDWSRRALIALFQGTLSVVAILAKFGPKFGPAALAPFGLAYRLLRKLALLLPVFNGWVLSCSQRFGRSVQHRLQRGLGELHRVGEAAATLCESSLEKTMKDPLVSLWAAAACALTLGQLTVNASFPMIRKCFVTLLWGLGRLTWRVLCLAIRVGPVLPFRVLFLAIRLRLLAGRVRRSLVRRRRALRRRLGVMRRRWEAGLRRRWGAVLLWARFWASNWKRVLRSFIEHLFLCWRWRTWLPYSFRWAPALRKAIRFVVWLATFFHWVSTVGKPKLRRLMRGAFRVSIFLLKRLFWLVRYRYHRYYGWDGYRPVELKRRLFRYPEYRFWSRYISLNYHYMRPRPQWSWRNKLYVPHRFAVENFFFYLWFFPSALWADLCRRPWDYPPVPERLPELTPVVFPPAFTLRGTPPHPIIPNWGVRKFLRELRPQFKFYRRWLRLFLWWSLKERVGRAGIRRLQTLPDERRFWRALTRYAMERRSSLYSPLRDHWMRYEPRKRLGLLPTGPLWRVEFPFYGESPLLLYASTRLGAPPFQLSPLGPVKPVALGLAYRAAVMSWCEVRPFIQGVTTPIYAGSARAMAVALDQARFLATAAALLATKPLWVGGRRLSKLTSVTDLPIVTPVIAVTRFEIWGVRPRAYHATKRRIKQVIGAVLLLFLSLHAPALLTPLRELYFSTPRVFRGTILWHKRLKMPDILLSDAYRGAGPRPPFRVDGETRPMSPPRYMTSMGRWFPPMYPAWSRSFMGYQWQALKAGPVKSPVNLAEAVENGSSFLALEGAAIRQRLWRRGVSNFRPARNPAWRALVRPLVGRPWRDAAYPLSRLPWVQAPYLTALRSPKWIGPYPALELVYGALSGALAHVHHFFYQNVCRAPVSLARTAFRVQVGFFSHFNTRRYLLSLCWDSRAPARAYPIKGSWFLFNEKFGALRASISPLKLLPYVLHMTRAALLAYRWETSLYPTLCGLAWSGCLPTVASWAGWGRLFMPPVETPLRPLCGPGATLSLILRLCRCLKWAWYGAFSTSTTTVCLASLSYHGSPYPFQVLSRTQTGLGGGSFNDPSLGAELGLSSGTPLAYGYQFNWGDLGGHPGPSAPVRGAPLAGAEWGPSATNGLVDPIDFFKPAVTSLEGPQQPSPWHPIEAQLYRPTPSTFNRVSRPLSDCLYSTRFTHRPSGSEAQPLGWTKHWDGAYRSLQAIRDRCEPSATFRSFNAESGQWALWGGDVSKRAVEQGPVVIDLRFPCRIEDLSLWTHGIEGLTWRVGNRSQFTHRVNEVRVTAYSEWVEANRSIVASLGEAPATSTPQTGAAGPTLNGPRATTPPKAKAQDVPPSPPDADDEAAKPRLKILDPSPPYGIDEAKAVPNPRWIETPLQVSPRPPLFTYLSNMIGVSPPPRPWNPNPKGFFPQKFSNLTRWEWKKPFPYDKLTCFENELPQLRLRPSTLDRYRLVHRFRAHPPRDSRINWRGPLWSIRGDRAAPPHDWNLAVEAVARRARIHGGLPTRPTKTSRTRPSMLEGFNGSLLPEEFGHLPPGVPRLDAGNPIGKCANEIYSCFPDRLYKLQSAMGERPYVRSHPSLLGQWSRAGRSPCPLTGADAGWGNRAAAWAEGSPFFSLLLDAVAPLRALLAICWRACVSTLSPWGPINQIREAVSGWVRAPLACSRAMFGRAHSNFVSASPFVGRIGRPDAGVEAWLEFASGVTVEGVAWHHYAAPLTYLAAVSVARALKWGFGFWHQSLCSVDTIHRLCFRGVRDIGAPLLSTHWYPLPNYPAAAHSNFFKVALVRSREPWGSSGGADALTLSIPIGHVSSWYAAVTAWLWATSKAARFAYTNFVDHRGWPGANWCRSLGFERRWRGLTWSTKPVWDVLDGTAKERKPRVYHPARDHFGIPTWILKLAFPWILWLVLRTYPLACHHHWLPLATPKNYGPYKHSYFEESRHTSVAGDVEFIETVLYRPCFGSNFTWLSLLGSFKFSLPPQWPYEPTIPRRLSGTGVGASDTRLGYLVGAPQSVNAYFDVTLTYALGALFGPLRSLERLFWEYSRRPMRIIRNCYRFVFKIVDTIYPLGESVFGTSWYAVCRLFVAIFCLPLPHYGVTFIPPFFTGDGAETIWWMFPIYMRPYLKRSYEFFFDGTFPTYPMWTYKGWLPWIGDYADGAQAYDTLFTFITFPWDVPRLTLNDMSRFRWLFIFAY